MHVTERTGSASKSMAAALIKPWKKKSPSPQHPPVYLVRKSQEKLKQSQNEHDVKEHKLLKR